MTETAKNLKRSINTIKERANKSLRSKLRDAESKINNLGTPQKEIDARAQANSSSPWRVIDPDIGRDSGPMSGSFGGGRKRKRRTKRRRSAKKKKKKKTKRRRSTKRKNTKRRSSLSR